MVSTNSLASLDVNSDASRKRFRQVKLQVEAVEPRPPSTLSATRLSQECSQAEGQIEEPTLGHQPMRLTSVADDDPTSPAAQSMPYTPLETVEHSRGTTASMSPDHDHAPSDSWPDMPNTQDGQPGSVDAASSATTFRTISTCGRTPPIVLPSPTHPVSVNKKLRPPQTPPRANFRFLPGNQHGLLTLRYPDGDAFHIRMPTNWRQPLVQPSPAMAASCSSLLSLLAFLALICALIYRFSI